MAAMRTKLVAAGGDVTKAGLTLQDVRNAIYTKALRVNPNIESQDAADAEGKPKKRAKTASTKRGTVDLAQMDKLNTDGPIIG
jgi:hypothetical protein